MLQALGALSKLNPQHQAAHVPAPAVASLLKHRRGSVRRKALQTLALMATDVQALHVDAILACLDPRHDNDADVCTGVLRLLARLREERPAVVGREVFVEGVKVLLGHDADGVRMMALEMLCEIAPEFLATRGAAQCVEDLLDHSAGVSTQYKLLGLLRGLGPEILRKHGAAVEPLLLHRRPEIRRRALKALTKMGADALEELASTVLVALAVEDVSPEVRAAAQQALGALAPAEQRLVAEDLEAWLGGDCQFGRDRARTALRALAPGVQVAARVYSASELASRDSQGEEEVIRDVEVNSDDY